MTCDMTIAFPISNKVGHLKSGFSELDTPPGCTSVNASPCRLPDTTHHSRPRRLARTYLVRLFHSLPSSGFYRRSLITRSARANTFGGIVSLSVWHPTYRRESTGVQKIFEP